MASIGLSVQLLLDIAKPTEPILELKVLHEGRQYISVIRSKCLFEFLCFVPFPDGAR